MKYLISACLLLVLASGASALPTHYYGEVSGSGIYQGNVDINFGWGNPPGAPNSLGEDINLWGVQAKAGDKLSFDISSDDLFTGFSLYFGEVTFLDLLFGEFNNSGDIGEATYVTGSTLWDLAQSLTDFTFVDSGFYTLIVGGKDFGGYEGYEYQMDVAYASVPEPAAFILLGSGLLGLVAARRRRQQQV